MSKWTEPWYRISNGSSASTWTTSPLTPRHAAAGRRAEAPGRIRTLGPLNALLEAAAGSYRDDLCRKVALGNSMTSPVDPVGSHLTVFATAGLAISVSLIRGLPGDSSVLPSALDRVSVRRLVPAALLYLRERSDHVGEENLYIGLVLAWPRSIATIRSVHRRLG